MKNQLLEKVIILSKPVKARFSAGNIKLGNIATFSKLVTDFKYNVIREGKALQVAGSCSSGCCAGCREVCYVIKSYRYPAVKTAHANNTLALRENLQQAYIDLDNQLTSKRKKFEVVRLMQAGEIESDKELAMWCKLARNHAESIFYLYTKNYEVVIPALKHGFVPANLIVNISVWHEQGLEAFNEVKHINNVKAFVYNDGDFDYTDKLEIETTCKAYEGGKLNHAITCNKCRKCFDSKFKVIATEPH